MSNTPPTKKNILFVTNNLNQWGQKKIAESLSTRFNVTVLTLDDGLYKSQYVNNQYIERRIVLRLETFLRLIIIPPKTTNYKYGKKRNYLSKKLNLKRKIMYSVDFLLPKLINEHFAAKILGHFKGNIDKVLEEINPAYFINLAFINKQYPAARAHKLGYSVQNIIYSWDNPYKDSFLPNIYTKYYVWNKESKTDLYRLHKVDPEKQIITNPIMFDYIFEQSNIQLNSIVSAKIEQYKYEYYLFLFSCGYRAAKQEVDFFDELIKHITMINPNRKIVLRPYPNVPDFDIYDQYKKMDNIIFQRNKSLDLLQSDIDVLEKKLVLKNARATFNLGTTMSLEASFFGHPIIQLAYIPDSITSKLKNRHRVLDIDYILKNDHLHKYLMKKEYPNVVYNNSQLSDVITDLENNSFEKYMPYTKYLNNLANQIIEKQANHILIEELAK